MLKSEEKSVRKTADIKHLPLNNLVTNPLENSSELELSGQREWNRNFKKVDMSNEIADLIQNMVEEVSNKKEAIINKYQKKQIKQFKLKPTANPNFMQNKDGGYYRLNEYEYIAEPTVVNVDEAGNYVTETEISGTKDILVSTYDINNKLIAIKVLNEIHKAYRTEKFVADKLNMKKEYVYPNKLHGYSGNSQGIAARIKNLLSSPILSGCYLGKGYSFFKWNVKNNQFEIDIRDGIKAGSPIMSDYEIKEDRVIRTDYDGVGLAW